MILSNLHKNNLKAIHILHQKNVTQNYFLRDFVIIMKNKHNLDLLFVSVQTGNTLVPFKMVFCGNGSSCVKIKFVWITINSYIYYMENNIAIGFHSSLK